MIERLDNLFFQAMAWLLLALGAMLPVWAALLVLVQCVTWLKSGNWQSVPAAAIFMTEEAQRTGLEVAQVRLSPLDLAPSFASLNSTAAVVKAFSGSAVGLAVIVAWLLDVGLSVWLLLIALLCLALSGMFADRAGDLVSRAGR